ncbi:MAG: polyribonucleotide nucleotidyltransferase [Candidatus Eisenbacteria bacterium]|nr:polyribonucleotide nucleotidyltransferase [Candidatus Eisenbacteria bacterium]
MHQVELDFGGRTLRLQTGRLAKQASASCLVQYADTIVHCAIVFSQETRPMDFLPLYVDYREKTYAAGRIPGGFFKREGRPNEKETTSARLVDRALRPFFNEDIRNEITITNEVLSSDQENDSDVLAMIASSVAVCLSDVPFPGPIGAVRVGKVNGELILNPTFSQLQESTIDLVFAGTRDSIIMTEGEAREIHEDEFLEAARFAQPEIVRLVELQEQLVALAGKPKRTIPAVELPAGLAGEVESRFGARVREVMEMAGKQRRTQARRDLLVEAQEAMAEAYPESASAVAKIFERIESVHVRHLVLHEGRRTDGRAFDQVRPIECEVALLPRTHGSALFQRGETQAMVVTTLGTSMDEQRIEELEGQSWKTFMLHYNFPSYSVGEARPNRGPSRREIGHGSLAERALTAVVPSNESFPYTIRIVSDIFESNGSSSMATVCGGSLSLMDAGVPIKAPVAGVAMGMIGGEGRYEILTDIQGVEDHLGDMDLKVAGTREGITAVQMDLKIQGLGIEALAQALQQARAARLHILDKMEAVLPEPRQALSRYAPRITVLQVPPEKIREIIGPGGKMIKKITDETGAVIDIQDTGEVKIACVDAAQANRAIEMIRAITEDPEVGAIYNGRVVRITNFGAFVEILPGKDGLIHISELDHKRVQRVEDVVREGEIVRVKVIGVDEEGKVRLSRKQAIEPPR